MKKYYCVHNSKLPKRIQKKTYSEYYPIEVIEEMTFGKVKVKVYWFDLDFIGNSIEVLCEDIVEKKDLCELSYEFLSKQQGVSYWNLYDVIQWEYGIKAHLLNCGIHRLLEKNFPEYEELGYYLKEEDRNTPLYNDGEQKGLLYTEMESHKAPFDVKHRIDVMLRLIEEHKLPKIN